MLLNRMFPLSTFEDLQREMDQVFNVFTRGGRGTRVAKGCGFPLVNVMENGECLFVEAEVPGVTMDDIQVQVVGDELSIKGQRKPMTPEGEEITLHRQERGMGEFSCVFTLPREVNREKVEAVLKNGVLTITLPKTDAIRPRKIAVKSN